MHDGGAPQIPTGLLGLLKGKKSKTFTSLLTLGGLFSSGALADTVKLSPFNNNASALEQRSGQQKHPEKLSIRNMPRAHAEEVKKALGSDVDLKFEG